MSNGNLPDVPHSWRELMKDILQWTTLVISFGTMALSKCNNDKIAQVDNKQTEVASKVEEVKASADQAEKQAAEAKSIAKSHAGKVEQKLTALEGTAISIKSDVKDIKAKPR